MNKYCCQPTKCEMPDISDLEYPMIGSLILRFMVCSDKGLSNNENNYIRNYVRLIDKAIFEYTSTRSALISEIAEPKRPVDELKKGRLIYTFVFVNHLENCLNAIRRLLDILRRLKPERNISFPRTLRKQIKCSRKVFIDMRDTIEHLDDRIQKGKLIKGQAIYLILTEDEKSVVLANNSISFIDLASIIRQLHKISLCIIKFYDDKINSKIQ